MFLTSHNGHTEDAPICDIVTDKVYGVTAACARVTEQSTYMLGSRGSTVYAHQYNRLSKGRWSWDFPTMIGCVRIVWLGFTITYRDAQAHYTTLFIQYGMGNTKLRMMESINNSQLVGQKSHLFVN